MQNVIKELRKIFQFKEETEVGDVIILYAEENKQIIYALVMDIVKDESKKGDWWTVYLLFLQIPPLLMPILLRGAQMSGKETFTMGGNGRFMAPIARLTAEEIIQLQNKARGQTVEPPKNEKKSPFKIIDGGKDKCT